ncbi:MAG: PqqD family protein [Acetobacterales bacterium]
MPDSDFGTFDAVSVHLLEDAAVLYDRSRRSLFAANMNAATIWLGLEQKVRPREVAEALAEEFGIERGIARQHVASTLLQWRRWCREAALRDASGGVGPRGRGQCLPFSPAAPAERHTYRLLDTVFAIQYGHNVPHWSVRPVFEYLGCDTAAGTERVIDIVRFGEGFAIAESGYLHRKCAAASQLASVMRDLMTESAINDSRGLAALQAAAVERNGTCILMPGKPGVGKSCLAAALAADGFTLLGDENVVLSGGEHSIRPLPFGLCIKDSPPAMLWDRFPGLAERAVHMRPDGTHVHYLTPPEIAIAPAAHRARVERIVFPRYFPGGETELIPIGNGNALQRMLSCFSPLGDSMNRRDIEALVAWVAATPCYALHVSSLCEAVRILRRFGT